MTNEYQYYTDAYFAVCYHVHEITLKSSNNIHEHMYIVVYVCKKNILLNTETSKCTNVTISQEKNI